MTTANSIYNFKNYLTKFINAKERENSPLFIFDPFGLKLLTRFRLHFSHLNEHKFRHNFRDTVNSMCPYYSLRCQNFALVRSNFLNRIFEINVEFRNMNDLALTLYCYLVLKSKPWMLFCTNF